MPKLPLETREAYDRSRLIPNPSYLCHAPFTNMYFNVAGEAAPCWLTFFESQKYPDSSIENIWFGGHFEKMRSKIANDEFPDACSVCERNIRNHLYLNPLARAYDLDRGIGKYPQIMEFELSNRCNLECVMCNGRLSSTVRKNRDGLPPKETPYDANFIDQLTPFLPHLLEARVNGGEPFLQEQAYALFDRIAETNPEIEITVATNGTVWSPRVESVLKRGKFRINVSLDGMTKATYESIRRNSNFERVMANLEKFGAYCRENNRIFSIMYNPMRNNWFEIPELVRFCSERGYHLWFNTIYRPFHLALWTLSSKELAEIQQSLEQTRFSVEAAPDAIVAASNERKFRNFVEGQLNNWRIEQAAREHRGEDLNSQKAARQNARHALREKMSSRVGSPERFTRFWEKVVHLEETVSANISGDDFYFHLSDRPLDWVVHDLEHKSSNQMIEELYSKAEYY